MIINTGLRTDIPGFFSEWFYNRIEEGHVYARNPYFKRQVYSYRLDPEIVDCIMFCTKNPQPMLKDLDIISDFNQLWFVTITPYREDIEPNVPKASKVIKSFKRLSEHTGKEAISLRYDPIFISDRYSLDYHMDSFERMAESISGYTSEIIISFIDLYEKTRRNFPQAREVNRDERLAIGREFSEIAKANDLTLKTCVEGKELDIFGIDSSGCMTKQVIERAIKNNLSIKVRKARDGQCECLLNNDIGAYNSCNHGCLYCYANANKNLVKRNLKMHDPDSPILIGNVKDNDIIKERNEPSFIDGQQRLF